ncbi:TPA: hypothetical protein ACG0BA_004444 [Serratia odorifera]
MTLTTETLNDFIAGQGFGVAPSAVEAMARELLANREAQPTMWASEMELSTAVGVTKDKVVADAWGREGLKVTPLYTAPPAPAVVKLPVQHYEELCRKHPDMSIGDAIIRAAWWNHCCAELLNSGTTPAPAVPDDTRDALRYRFLKDKDAWGCDNEPGLVEWDDLIDLEGNEFDAAIDARISNSDVNYTAPSVVTSPNVRTHRKCKDKNCNAPIVGYSVDGLCEDCYLSVSQPPATAVPDAINTAIRYLKDTLVACNRFNYCSDAVNRVENACRAAMLAQPVSSGYKLVPVDCLTTASRLIDLCRTYAILSDGGNYKERTINECENTMEVIDGLLAVSPDGGN